MLSTIAIINDAIKDRERKMHKFKDVLGNRYTVHDELIEGEECKMTREEAKAKLEAVIKNNHIHGYVGNSVAIDDWLDSIEALGLIKFKEKEVNILFTTRTKTEAVFRVEQWPEGFVVWYDGEIVWKEWKA